MTRPGSANARRDGENRVVLEGRLPYPPKNRDLPSGETRVTFTLEHRSRPRDLKPPQELALHLTVLAVGRLARESRELETGTRLTVSGRLNQKRTIRNGRTRWEEMELVAEAIEIHPPDEVDGADDGNTNDE